MTINDESGVVYESPDGGKTVYSRRIGSMERTLVYQSPEAITNLRYIKWKDILSVSEKYPALDYAIKQAEFIYEIIKEEE